jgi:hypothetical protein
MPGGFDAARSKLTANNTKHLRQLRPALSSRRIGYFVAADVVLIISVSAHPLSFDVMQLCEPVNFLPQLAILYRLVSLPSDSVDPTLSFPSGWRPHFQLGQHHSSHRQHRRARQGGGFCQLS